MRNKILLIPAERIEILGGGLRFILNFYKNLKRKGYEVEIMDFDLIDNRKYPQSNEYIYIYTIHNMI